MALGISSCRVASAADGRKMSPSHSVSRTTSCGDRMARYPVTAGRVRCISPYGLVIRCDADFFFLTDQHVWVLSVISSCEPLKLPYPSCIIICLTGSKRSTRPGILGELLTKLSFRGPGQ